MTKVSGNISQLGVSGSIAQLGVSGSISQLSVSGGLAEAGVTNIPAVFVSAEIGDIADNKVVITFDKALDESSVPATTAFALSGITGSPSVSAVAISTLYVTLTLSGNGAEGDTITVDYTKPGSNPLQDTINVEIDSFSGESVTNNIVPTYCAEFNAVYNSWTNKPDAADADIWDTMVAALVAGGYWTRFDVFVFMAIHSNADGEAYKWWTDPTKTMTGYNAPTFTAFEGINSGVTGYIDMNYNPSTMGSQYTLNKNSVAVYNRVNSAVAGFDIGGTDGSIHTHMACRFSNNNAYCKNNNNLQPGGANTDSSGLMINDRPDSANNAIYRNNSLIASQARAATGIPNISFYLDSWNNNGTPYATRTNRQKAYAWVGDSFTTEERLAIQTICETALDAKGKGVIA